MRMKNLATDGQRLFHKIIAMLIFPVTHFPNNWSQPTSQRQQPEKNKSDYKIYITFTFG